jgi:hypothetical protein
MINWLWSCCSSETPTRPIQTQTPFISTGIPIATLAPPPPVQISATANVPKGRKNISSKLKQKTWQLMFYGQEKAICAMCGDKEMLREEGTTWEVSHIIPFNDLEDEKKLSEEEMLENLRPLCRTCNRTMGKRNFVEYSYSHYRLKFDSLMNTFKIDPEKLKKRYEEWTRK